MDFFVAGIYTLHKNYIVFKLKEAVINLFPI